MKKIYVVLNEDDYGTYRIGNFTSVKKARFAMQKAASEEVEGRNEVNAEMRKLYGEDCERFAECEVHSIPECDVIAIYDGEGDFLSEYRISEEELQ